MCEPCKNDCLSRAEDQLEKAKDEIILLRARAEGAEATSEHWHDALKEEKKVSEARKTMADNWAKEAEAANLQVGEQQKKLESYETYIQVLQAKLRGEKPVPIEQVIEELGQAEKRNCDHDWEPYILGADIQCTKCKMLKDGAP